jgi:hypothetical protein
LSKGEWGDLKARLKPCPTINPPFNPPLIKGGKKKGDFVYATIDEQR